MKKYESPEFDVILLNTKDIIVCSVGQNDNNEMISGGPQGDPTGQSLE